jgi:hypothetical protein
LLSRQFHQQAGASILHLSFLFRDEGIYTWETVDGGVCSVHWTGLVALAWLDGGWSGCIWTVGGFTGHSFRTFSSLSLTRELEYPLLSICICCSALLRHIYSSIATYRLSLSFDFLEVVNGRENVMMDLHFAWYLAWIDLMGMV